jgi:hypothetical protein
MVKGSAPSIVKIGLAGGYAPNFLPVLVAMGAGYYDQVAARFHTSISFDVYGGGLTGEAAFLGGTDQFEVIAPASYLPAYLGGKDQVFIFGENNALGIDMIAPLKYKATRSSVAEFNSGTWCQISPIGTSNTGALLEAALNHLDISKLNLTTIGSVAAVLPSVQTGRCDIVSGDVNSAASGIINGVSYVVDNLQLTPPTVHLMGDQMGIPLSTSHAFLSQYPQLSRAIVDATLEGLRFIQHNLNNANAVYDKLPAEAQAAAAIGAFAEAYSLLAPSFGPEFTSGEFTTQEVNDTLWNLEAAKTIPVGSEVNPSRIWDNAYVIQAYKDLHLPKPTGGVAGPLRLPSTMGKPSLEAANAFAILTGQPAPPNAGPASFGTVSSGTSTTG